MSASDRDVLSVMRPGLLYTTQDIASLIGTWWPGVVSRLTSLERRGLIRKASTTAPQTMWELCK